MRAWIEKDNPLLDRPDHATVWVYEWNDDEKYYETSGWDIELGSLSWTTE